MTPDKIIVTFSGLGLIIFIWWFFFGKKDVEVEGSGELDIIVDGGYSPANIRIKKGKITTLKIIRKDSNSCLEEIIIPGFKVKKYLPLNKLEKIKINPQEVGEYGFHCAMNMYHGKIIVE